MSTNAKLRYIGLSDGDPDGMFSWGLTLHEITPAERSPSPCGIGFATGHYWV